MQEIHYSTFYKAFADFQIYDFIDFINSRYRYIDRIIPGYIVITKKIVSNDVTNNIKRLIKQEILFIQFTGPFCGRTLFWI